MHSYDLLYAGLLVVGSERHAYLCSLNWSAMTDRHISVDANIVVLNASKKYSTYFYFYTSPEVSMSFSFFHCSCQICVCSGTLSGQAV